MLVWGGVASRRVPFTDGAAYDPDADTWRTLPSTGAGALAERTGATWTGEELILVGVASAPNAFLASDTFAFDPASGDWRALEPTPAGVSGDLPDAPPIDAPPTWRAVWTDSELLAVRRVPGPFREFPVAVAQEGTLYVWGGDACGPAASCIEVVDPGPGLIWTPPEIED